MTLLFLDSFDSYASNADLATRWTVSAGGAGDISYATVGRNGIGKALKHTDDSNYIQRLIGSNEAVLFCGFAFKADDFTSGSAVSLFSLFDSVTEQCGLALFDSQPYFYRSNLNAVLGAATRAFRAGKWYYVEIKMTVTSSLGVAGMILKVNGETWIQLDSGNSQDSANAYADSFMLGNWHNNHTDMYYDDFYILNPTGAAPYNTFLGNVQIESIRPNGNGTTSNFTGSDADSTDNYLHIDEVDPDGDTSYLESEAVGDIDLHTLGSLVGGVPQTIFGVQSVLVARKTSSGSRTGRHVLRTGASNYTGSSFSPEESFLGFEEVWEENPDTVLPWVEADITGLESGIKVQA